ncbi:MAG: hypothetical protein OQK29_01230 [Ignavibacteriaceae bacterium]|nr:hypothetical protein [Ignavibacteriaceae bacterium]
MSFYDNKKWCVYINGADECLATKTFKSAVKKSAKINKQFLDMESAFKNNSTPLCFAQVELWDNVCDANHNPDSVNWCEHIL